MWLHAMYELPSTKNSPPNPALASSRAMSLLTMSVLPSKSASETSMFVLRMPALRTSNVPINEDRTPLLR